MTPNAPDPSRFRSSPVGMRMSTPTASPRGPSRITAPFTRTIRSPRPLAEPPASKLRFEPMPSWRIGIAEEVHGCRVHRAQPPHGRRRGHVQARLHDRHGQRHVEPVGQTVGQRAGPLADRHVNRARRRHDVGAAAAELEVVVREDRRHGAQVDAFQLIEREVLEVEAEGEPSAADGLGPVGENRAEALRGSDKRACRRVEAVREPRGGRGQRQRRELAGQRDVELREVRLERAVEVRRMRGPVRQHGLAVDDQAVGAEEIGKHRRQPRGPRLCERRWRRAWPSAA